MKKTLLLLTILLTINIIAQNLSQLRVVGSSEYLPSELISSDIRDSNGDVCAAVIVSTDISGLSFDAYNGIVKVNSKPGRHFIFVSPTERVIEIFKSGYKPLQIILNDYGISLKSGQTWELEITGDKKVATNYSGKSNFILHTEPEGAMITIDGIPTFSETTPYSFEEWNAGVYKITLTKNEYYKKDCQIIIDKDGEISQTEKLTPTFGYVYVGTTIKDAKIKIGNKYYTNNKYNKIPIGNYQLTVLRDEYDNITKQISVESGDTVTFSSLNLIAKFGFIKVNCNIENINILLGDKKLENYELTKLPLGKCSLKITSEHYKTYQKEIDILPNKTKNVNVDLVPILGTISFVGLTSADNGADVYLDDKFIGKLPIKEKEFLEGKHELLIKKEGAFDKTIEFYINEGVNPKEEIALDREKEITINSFPQDAKVSLDGKYLGKTPLKVETSVGNLKLSFSKEGYDDKSETISITSNNTDYSINLESQLIKNIRIADFSLLFGQKDFPDSLFIDGEYRGGLGVYSLYPGKHVFELRHKKEVAVIKNHLKTIRVKNVISKKVSIISDDSDILFLPKMGFNYISFGTDYINSLSKFSFNFRFLTIPVASMLEYERFYFENSLNDSLEIIDGFSLLGNIRLEIGGELTSRSGVSIFAKGFYPGAVNWDILKEEDPEEGSKKDDVFYHSFGLSFYYLLSKGSNLKVTIGYKDTFLEKLVYEEDKWTKYEENQNSFIFMGIEIGIGIGHNFIKVW